MKFTETTYTNALTLGYNAVQVKYGGEHVRIEMSRGQGRIYSARDGRPVDSFELDDGPVVTLFGNYLVADGAKTVIVWDCLRIGDQPYDNVRLEYSDVRSYSYRNRYALARERLGECRNVRGLTLFLIETFRVEQAPDLWTTLPDRNTRLKVTGIVYRKTNATGDEPVLVSRWYPELPSGIP